MNLITPINQLGYGIAGLNIAKALSKQCDLAVWAHGDRAEVGTPDDVPIIQELIGKRMVADFDRPCLKIWHQHDMSMFVGKSTHIGFPFFELDEFSEIEKKIADLLDEYVRPAVEQDGGFISLKKFEKGIVTVSLQGACSGCPSSSMTLKSGIEGLLKKEMPEQIVEVIAEND